MDIYKKDKVMNKFNKLNLKGNPFRVTPAINSKDIIWAGFPDLKKHIEDSIKRSINIPNTLKNLWQPFLCRLQQAFRNQFSRQR